MARPLKVSLSAGKNQIIDTHDRFSFGENRPNFVNKTCVPSAPTTHTPICMMIFSILTFNNYCATYKAVIE